MAASNRRSLKEDAAIVIGLDHLGILADCRVEIGEGLSGSLLSGVGQAPRDVSPGQVAIGGNGCGGVVDAFLPQLRAFVQAGLDFRSVGRIFALSSFALSSSAAAIAE